MQKLSIEYSSLRKDTRHSMHKSQKKLEYAFQNVPHILKFWIRCITLGGYVRNFYDFFTCSLPWVCGKIQNTQYISATSQIAPWHSYLGRKEILSRLIFRKIVFWLLISFVCRKWFICAYILRMGKKREKWGALHYFQRGSRAGKVQIATDSIWSCVNNVI